MFERNRCYAHVNGAIELQYQHCAVKCDGKPIVDVSDAVNLADNPTATQNSRTPMQSEKKKTRYGAPTIIYWLLLSWRRCQQRRKKDSMYISMYQYLNPGSMTIYLFCARYLHKRLHACCDACIRVYRICKCISVSIVYVYMFLCNVTMQ